jgi:hypothetical protein
MKRLAWALLVLAALCLQVARKSAAQAPSAPSKPQVTAQQGQTAEQQKKDLQECYEVAKGRTGIDPQALTGLVVKSKSAPGGTTAQTSDAVASPEETAASMTQKEVGQPEKGAPANAAADDPASAPSSAANINGNAKMDLFGAADQACLQARGYLVKGGEAPVAKQPSRFE